MFAIVVGTLNTSRSMRGTFYNFTSGSVMMGISSFTTAKPWRNTIAKRIQGTAGDL